MERRQLWIGVAGAVAVVLFVMVIIRPMRRDVRRLEAALPQLNAEVEQMAQLAEQYKQLEADEETLRRWLQMRQPEFALFTYVTRVSQSQRLKLASLQPSARALGNGWQLETVEIAIQDVSLSALVKFLYALMSPENVVQIDRFTMRGDARKVSVTFEAQTLVRTE